MRHNGGRGNGWTNQKGFGEGELAFIDVGVERSDWARVKFSAIPLGGGDLLTDVDCRGGSQRQVRFGYPTYQVLIPIWLLIRIQVRCRGLHFYEATVFMASAVGISSDGTMSMLVRF